MPRDDRSDIPEFRFDDHAPAPEPAPRPGTGDRWHADELAGEQDLDPVIRWAPEPAAPRFGRKGELVLAAASNSAGIYRSEFSNSEARYFSASFGSGLDYFVVDHFSIGFHFEGSHSDNTGYGADGSLVESVRNSIDAGIRLGADFPLGNLFSIYPRVTLGLSATHQTESLVAGQSLSVASSAIGSPSSTSVGPWVNVFVPLLVHPVPHFFFGVGPRINHSFADMTGSTNGIKTQSTLVGGQFEIGGWWGGPDASGAASNVAPAERPPEDGRIRRFGDRGTWVLTNSTSAQALFTGYSGTGASNLNVEVAPGFDVFVGQQFSLGLDVNVGYSKAVGLQAGGGVVTVKSKSLGVAPRIGVAIPLGDLVTLYPRLEVGAGPMSQDEVAAGSENQHTDTRVWFEADIPILVHVARHYFVGAGPSLSHDLSRTDQNGYSNQETTVGADLVLGGWL